MILADTILSNIVTFQDNVQAKAIKEISIRDFLLSIKNGRYGNYVSRLRHYLEDSDKKRYSQEKTRLPSVTFSGLFYDMRRIENLAKYNNICVIDIDNISSSQEISRLMDLLCSDPYIFSLWLSPSGRGIKGLVKFGFLIEPSISTAHSNHTFAFHKLRDYIKAKYNIEIDNSGSDVTRLCFVSSDINLLQKETIEEFFIDNQNIHIPELEKKPKPYIKNSYFILKEHMNPRYRNKQIKRTKIQKIIRILKKRKLSITDTYESWYRVAYALSNTFTYDLGQKYYLQLCRLDGAYHNEGESINMLQYCYVNSNHSISFGTIQFYFNKLIGGKGELC